ncbi:MAG: hypothetical protein R6V40_03310 [Candidatus Moraniibacteriota bacterium]
MPDNMNAKKEGERFENLEKGSSRKEELGEKTEEEGFKRKKEDVERENKISEEALKQVREKATSSKDGMKKQKKDERGVFEELTQMENTEDRINKLMQVASQEGPQKAIKIAEKLNRNYVLDKVHDNMVNEGELRDELIKKGFIKEE